MLNKHDNMQTFIMWSHQIVNRRYIYKSYLKNILNFYLYIPWRSILIL
jgi:hypothetical protein